MFVWIIIITLSCLGGRRLELFSIDFRRIVWIHSTAEISLIVVGNQDRTMGCTFAKHDSGHDENSDKSRNKSKNKGKTLVLEGIPDIPPPAPVDPRLPLTAKQRFSIGKSWKGIARAMEPTGVNMFVA